MLMKAGGRFTRNDYIIAGNLRMDTLGSLKRIAMILAIVTGYKLYTVSRQSIIHINKFGTN